MKRTRLFWVLATALLSQGCTGQCANPSVLAANTYDVFATPMSIQNGNDAFAEGPDFWSYGSPSNGSSRWSIKWGASEVGAVDVVIDGQTFSGQGELDPVECGQMYISGLSGVYTSESTGATHDFNANLALTVYGTELGGEMRWAEAWQSPDGNGGQYKADVQLTGVVLGAR